MKRRTLLGQSFALAGSGLLAGPGTCRAAVAGSSGLRTLTILGDIHFDRLEHHDFDWVQQNQPNDLRQIENYSQISRDNLPALFSRVRESSRQADSSLIIQIGDLVEGLCGNAGLARRQCEEALSLLENQDFGIPLTITKGNHDIAGPGAEEAYEEVFLPSVEENLRNHGRTTSVNASNRSDFAIPGDGTWLVHFDAYHRESLSWFEEFLSRRADNHRLIFLTHPPVVPYNARSAWTIFGSSESGQANRAKLMRILGRHRAIVLCGHLHKYSFLERDTPEGSFTQFAVSSVAYGLDDKPKDLISGIDNYQPDLVDLEPAHSPATVSDRRDLLTREKPQILQFDYGIFWGHANVDIGPTDVKATIYRFLEKEPWKTIRIDPLQGVSY